MSPSPGFFDTGAFDAVARHFAQIADYLEIPADHRAGLLLPCRSHVATLPLRRDDGTWSHYQSCRVQHQWLRGPAKGGTRFAPDLNLGEATALAVWMSWKCALMELPFGGGKGGIACDPKQLSRDELRRLTRAYIDAMAPVIGVEVDVMAPDIGTSETTMAWMAEAYAERTGKWQPGIVTGKPVERDGLEGRSEATGFGVALLARKAFEMQGGQIEDARIIVQGFGNVGSIAASYLAGMGARIVGVSDHAAAYYDARGLDVSALQEHAVCRSTLYGYSPDQVISRRDVLVQPCDILIPAAREGAIDADVAANLQCQVIAEGANGPTTNEADTILATRRRDVFVVPDILCNAGGVSASYIEWLQNCRMQRWTRTAVLSRVEGILTDAFDTVTRRSDRDQISMRLAANAIAVERLHSAYKERGALSPARVDSLSADRAQAALSLSSSTQKAC